MIQVTTQLRLLRKTSALQNNTNGMTNSGHDPWVTADGDPKQRPGCRHPSHRSRVWANSKETRRSPTAFRANLWFVGRRQLEARLEDTGQEGLCISTSQRLRAGGAALRHHRVVGLLPTRSEHTAINRWV